MPPSDAGPGAQPASYHLKLKASKFDHLGQPRAKMVKVPTVHKDAAKAHAALESGQHIGKFVLHVAEI